MKKLKFIILSTMLASSVLVADVEPSTNTPVQNAPGQFTPAQPQLYTFPGFVFQRDNDWVGSDYLYNLQNDIGLSVELLTPENEQLSINAQKLTDIVANAFRNNKLNVRVNPSPGPGALPFFYVQIMVFPTDQGNVALVTGSLFEPITLNRISTQKDAVLQAITWEKKTMFMSTPDNFEADLTKTVSDIANIFGERWRLFESMKPKTGGGSNPNLNSIRPGTRVLPRPQAAPAHTPSNAPANPSQQQKSSSSFSGTTFSPPPPSGKFSNM